MKTTLIRPRGALALLAAAGVAAFAPAAHSQAFPWGLTLTNINNPIAPIVVTNAPGNTNGPGGVAAPTGSISVIAGGGDTYSNPDSFTYAYQQVTGDFDIRVRVLNVTATDPQGQDSPKGSLMVRASLSPASPDFMINALPLAPSGRQGQIESIGRVAVGNDTDDLPGRGQIYGGDTTAAGYCTYPDLWLRVQRQGNKLMSYFATANQTDFPPRSSPQSTNGWQLLVMLPVGTNFGSTVYVGLATVAHNNDIGDTTHTVTSTYSDYGPTPALASLPSANGSLVGPTQAPGPFPAKQVAAVNFYVSLPADGQGYPGNTLQSAQGSPSPIVWNNGGFGSVSRDEIVDFITQETAVGFSAPRYQLGAFDFELSPRDPVAANQNFGPYTNPNRDRYSAGDLTVAGSQAYAPAPTHGFAISTVHKNGAAWIDGSPAFHAATYMQLDNGTSSQAYDMIGGHFTSGWLYTRHTKLVTGDTGNPALPGGPASGNLQRAAVPISIAYFPYEQGWKAGYFDNPKDDGTPVWKFGNGWGSQSGAALSGITYQYDGNGSIIGGQSAYNSPQFLLTWLDPYQDGTYAGLAQFSLPGVNSLNDGILFTVGNDENNSIRGPFANNAALPDGSGWYVAVRDIETSKNDPTIYASSGGNDSGRSFSFLYVPYNADNLVAGHIGTNGTTIKGAGSFTVQHLSTGRYAVTIPGKSDATGMLLLQNTGYLAQQPSGYTNVVDTSLLSYEFGGTNTPATAFIIESRFVQADNTGTVDGIEALRDGEFNFVYVDFKNPLAPPGYTPKVSIAPNGTGSVTVTWNGTLQSASAVTGPYTNVTGASPLTVSTTGPAKFYRAVR